MIKLPPPFVAPKHNAIINKIYDDFNSYQAIVAVNKWLQSDEHDKELQEWLKSPAGVSHNDPEGYT